MLLIEYAGTKAGLRHLSNTGTPHFEVVIKGRTKGIRLEGKGFTMPCVASTSVTKLRPGLWIQRFITQIEKTRKTRVRLFEREKRIPRLIEFEDDWFETLEQVQAKTNLIDKSLDLRSEAGILRSIRRGLTAHALNLQISETLIRSINRWRKEREGKKTGLQMIDRYADLTALKESFLAFSYAL